MRRRVFYIIGCIIVILFFVVSILNIPIFKLKKIEVYGNNTISYFDIVNYTNLFYGENLLKINKKYIKEQLLKNPIIKDASLKIRLPDTLEINVKERDIVGAIAYMGTFLIIDDGGVLVKLDSNTENLKIPVISGVEIAKYELGKKLEAKDANKFDFLLLCLKEIKNNSMEEDVNSIEAQNDDKIVITTKDNFRIILVDKDINFSFLKSVLKDLREKGYKSGELVIGYKDRVVFKAD